MREDRRFLSSIIVFPFGENRIIPTVDKALRMANVSFESMDSGISEKSDVNSSFSSTESRRRKKVGGGDNGRATRITVTELTPPSLSSPSGGRQAGEKNKGGNGLYEAELRSVHSDSTASTIRTTPSPLLRNHRIHVNFIADNGTRGGNINGTNKASGAPSSPARGAATNKLGSSLSRENSWRGPKAAKQRDGSRRCSIGGKTSPPAMSTTMSTSFSSALDAITGLASDLLNSKPIKPPSPSTEDDDKSRGSWASGGSQSYSGREAREGRSRRQQELQPLDRFTKVTSAALAKADNIGKMTMSHRQTLNRSPAGAKPNTGNSPETARTATSTSSGGSVESSHRAGMDELEISPDGHVRTVERSEARENNVDENGAPLSSIDSSDSFHSTAVKIGGGQLSGEPSDSEPQTPPRAPLPPKSPGRNPPLQMCTSRNQNEVENNITRSSPMARMRNEELKKATALSPENVPIPLLHDHNYAEGNSIYQIAEGDRNMLPKPRRSSSNRMEGRGNFTFRKNDEEESTSSSTNNRCYRKPGRRRTLSSKCSPESVSSPSLMDDSSRQKQDDDEGSGRRKGKGGSRKSRKSERKDNDSQGADCLVFNRSAGNSRYKLGEDGRVLALGNVVPRSPMYLLRQMMQKNCGSLVYDSEECYSSEESEESDFTYETEGGDIESILSGETSPAPTNTGERGRSRGRRENINKYTNAASKKKAGDGSDAVSTATSSMPGSRAGSVDNEPATPSSAVAASPSFASTSTARTSGGKKNIDKETKSLTPPRENVVRKAASNESAPLPPPPGGVEDPNILEVIGWVGGKTKAFDASSIGNLKNDAMSVGGDTLSSDMRTRNEETKAETATASGSVYVSDEVIAQSKTPPRATSAKSKEKKKKEKKKKQQDEGDKVEIHDKNFVRAFIEETTKKGLRLLWHKEQDAQCYTKPTAIKMFMMLGAVDNTDTFQGPRLVWDIVEGNALEVTELKGAPTEIGSGSIDLFDIHSVEKAGIMNLHSYPFALPGNSFSVSMNNRDVYLFEAANENEQRRIIHGLQWVVARLAFNLIIGNRDVCCELLTFAGMNDRGGNTSPLIGVNERLASKAMNDVTNHLVTKTISRANHS